VGSSPGVCLVNAQSRSASITEADRIVAAFHSLFRKADAASLKIEAQIVPQIKVVNEFKAASFRSWDRVGQTFKGVIAACTSPRRALRRSFGSVHRSAKPLENQARVPLAPFP
jgi:hypothetical protein